MGARAIGIVGGLDRMGNNMHHPKRNKRSKGGKGKGCRLGVKLKATSGGRQMYTVVSL